VWSESVVRLVKEKFVPLTVDGRIVNFCHDSETEFLSKPTICVANGAHGGAHVVTAGGRRLGWAELHHAPGVFQKSLEKALKAFAALPPAERAPGAVRVPERGAIDPKRVAALGPPPGALIIRVYNRQLGRTAKGEPRYTEPEDYIPALRDPAVVGMKTACARFREPANDMMWVAEKEWRAMMPERPTKGQQVAVPVSLCERLFRFHLDPARGLSESDSFYFVTAKVGQLRLTVEAVSGSEVRLRLDGHARLYDPRRHLLNYQSASVKKHSRSQAALEYEPRLLGYLAYDPGKKVFTRFDVVALGDVRGRPVDSNLMGERLGEANLLGIAFELVTRPRPADLLSPKGLRNNGGRYDLRRYLGAAN
jgi:hypothetical protein